MIYLYDENLFWSSRFKNRIKAVLGLSARGPRAVEKSLFRGLKELKKPFVLNNELNFPVGSACVLSGSKTLAWAIKKKQQGLVKRLIAGPNIVTTPMDFKMLIQNPVIDKILVPSLWVKNWWVSLASNIENKIFIWPAGVEDRGALKNSSGKVLIFQKNAPKELLSFITEHLSKKGFDFDLLIYGNFSPEQYLKLLSMSKFMIYLSESESQGLALHEAWMADVPTLIWNCGVVEYNKYVWKDNLASAPYYVGFCGKFFSSSQDFTVRLEEFLQRLDNFHPRKYSLENFTDKICAEKLIDIING